ncbi:helix-turn-helix transcriptional regulator [Cryptosporangium phraense]|uniref:Helix-turn-helix transcriptional regulator n=1 Tax=Cryptosporangium phraense TaxID=2593070 RepID=A0A545AV19_9ACTN|nr:helix-turn-helix transcriptional regulator [Cryptosporangium phraense]TQS45153.1 helix-turn-helix transcriptional regulator [Cryptosporangium phraense]
MHAPQRSWFETTDPEQARAVMAAAYSDNQLRLHGSADNFHFVQGRSDLGGVHFDTLRISMTTQLVGDPIDSVMIGHIVGSQPQAFDIRSGADERRYVPGDVFFGIQPDEEYAITYHGIDVHAVGLDLSLLDQIVDEPAIEVVHRFSTQPLNVVRARTWQHVVDLLETALSVDAVAASSPLVLGSAGRLLAATMVALWDPDHGEQKPRDRPEATPHTVRRAVAFIEANPHVDVSVADIAQASHVGVRALQNAFRRHLDTTPMAYLRRVRLDRAHRDLLAGDPALTTVAKVAARWGFADHSRFTAAYRDAYGCPPSVTLRRR